MEKYWILLTILIISSMVCIVGFIYSRKELNGLMVGMVGFLLVIVTAHAINFQLCKDREQEFVEELNRKESALAERSDYTIYLDGNEVDPDKIDLHLYRISYDDEKEAIYITSKSSF